MGNTDDNFKGIAHTLGTVFVEVIVQHHRADQQIDTEKSATPSQSASLRTAAQSSQSAFDTAAGPVFGSTWYGARPAQWQAAARRWFAATDFAAL